MHGFSGSGTWTEHRLSCLGSMMSGGSHLGRLRCLGIWIIWRPPHLHVWHWINGLGWDKWKAWLTWYGWLVRLLVSFPCDLDLFTTWWPQSSQTSHLGVQECFRGERKICMSFYDLASNVYRITSTSSIH